MRRVLQIIALSTGGVSILAAIILGTIYFSDVIKGVKNNIKRTSFCINKFIDNFVMHRNEVTKRADNC